MSELKILQKSETPATAGKLHEARWWEPATAGRAEAGGNPATAEQSALLSLSAALPYWRGAGWVLLHSRE